MDSDHLWRRSRLGGQLQAVHDLLCRNSLAAAWNEVAIDVDSKNPFYFTIGPIQLIFNRKSAGMV